MKKQSVKILKELPACQFVPFSPFLKYTTSGLPCAAGSLRGIHKRQNHRPSPVRDDEFDV